MITAWLKQNADAIKAVGAIVQSIAVVGGIVAAVYGLVLSPKVEERQRVQVTIPYLQSAYTDKLNSARDAYRSAAGAVIEDKILMCGSRPGCIGRYDEMDLLKIEERMSGGLRPLAHYYSVLARCVESHICSVRAACVYLCADATEIYEGVKAIRGHVLDRIKWQALGISPQEDPERVQEILRERENSFQGELDKRKEEMERTSRVLEGLGSFAEQCLQWNKDNPDMPVKVITDPFIVYR